MEVYPLALYSFAFYLCSKPPKLSHKRLLTGNPIIVTSLLLETSPKREIISGVKAEINLNKTQN